MDTETHLKVENILSAFFFRHAFLFSIRRTKNQLLKQFFILIKTYKSITKKNLAFDLKEQSSLLINATNVKFSRKLVERKTTF